MADDDSMMWYAELLLAMYVLILFCGCAYFRDLSAVQYQVDSEAVRLAGCLMQMQERSRNYHYLKNSDFHPFCNIYKDKYIIQNEQGKNSEIYCLQNGVRINFFDTANFYTFRQSSLYGGLPNKTLKVYKDNVAKYIIINRVGRIRISKYYEEPS